MRVRTPDYYKDFECIAGDCKDTCCAGWEVDVDENSQKFYEKVTGPFGKRLKDNTIIDKDGIRFKLLEKKRCCFLNDRELCDLYTALGKEHLCDTCADFPRFYEEFGDLKELGVSLSCPTAASLILNYTDELTFSDREINTLVSLNDIDYDLYMQLAAAREMTYSILHMRDKSLIWRNTAILLLANDIQKLIFKGRYREIAGVTARFKSTAYINMRVAAISRHALRFVDAEANVQNILDVFKKLEVVNPNWTDKLQSAGQYAVYTAQVKNLRIRNEQYTSAGKNGKAHLEQDGKRLRAPLSRSVSYEQIMIYFVYRYFMKAVYDYDLISKVKFAVISYIVIRSVINADSLLAAGGLSQDEFVWLVHMYSRELEHSDENMDRIKELSGSDMTFHIEALIATMLRCL